MDSQHWRTKSPSDLDLGSWGTCALTLRSDGTLSIGSGRAGREMLAEALGDQVSSVTEVRLSGKVVAPLFGCRMFAGLATVVRMDLRGLDTSSTFSMSCMFDGCPNLGLSLEKNPIILALYLDAGWSTPVRMRGLRAARRHEQSDGRGGGRRLGRAALRRDMLPPGRGRQGAAGSRCNVGLSVRPQ